MMASIVLAILYLSGLDRVTNDRASLHTLFYALSRKYDCLRLVFKEDVLFPESRELDEIILALIPGFLEMDDSYRWLLPRKDRCARWWAVEGDKLLARCPKLREIAEEFKREMEG